MGRPKRHKRDETLHKAMDFFWKNGFAAASIRDLGKVLDLHPGSLYSSFGSKENLYLEALDKFAEVSGRCWSEALDESRDFLSGLRNYLELITSDSDGPCTCMFSKTLATDSPEAQVLVERARAHIHSFRDEIAERIFLAIRNGEFSEDVVPQDLANLVQVQILGLRAFADSEPGAAQIGQAIESSLSLIALDAQTSKV